MDSVVALELAGGLDTFPSRGDLDQYTLLLNANGLVERNELLRLLLGGFLIERQAGVDLSRDTSGNDFEDFLAEFDELHERI